MTVFKKITNVLANLIEVKKNDMFDYEQSKIRLYILVSLWTTSFIILIYIVGRVFNASIMQVAAVGYIWWSGVEVCANVFKGLCFEHAKKYNFKIVATPSWLSSDALTLENDSCRFKVLGVPKSYYDNKEKGDVLKLSGLAYTRKDGIEEFLYTDENPIDKTNNMLVAMIVYFGLLIFFPAMGL